MDDELQYDEGVDAGEAADDSYTAGEEAAAADNDQAIESELEAIKGNVGFLLFSYIKKRMSWFFLS